jgi:hypothetical protein
MSGPKVVRIVTREEILAICEAHIARVEAAVSEWIRIGRRNDCTTEDEEAAATRKIATFRGLLAADRFGDLQKKAPAEIALLHEDMQGRLAKVADAEAAARSAERRRTEAQAVLFERMSSAGLTITEGLRERVVSGDQTAFTEAVRMLSGKSADEQHRDQAALASRYRQDETQDLDGLLDAIAREQSPRIQKLDLLLAGLRLETEVLGDDFNGRLLQATRASDDRQTLLLDSLELDLAKAVTTSRTQAALAREYRLSIAELASFEPDAAQSFEALGATDARLAEVRSAIEHAQAGQAATARRSALLRNLASLGYEATEGMETAWVEDGKVVLRKPAHPGYGVEVSGDGAAGRVQMRIVAFDGESTADAVRDRDAETFWCGDIAELESRLAKAGGGLQIERSLPIGATPVKRVAAPAGSADRTAREGRTVGTKSLK